MRDMTINALLTQSCGRFIHSVIQAGDDKHSGKHPYDEELRHQDVHCGRHLPMPKQRPRLLLQFREQVYQHCLLGRSEMVRCGHRAVIEFEVTFL